MFRQTKNICKMSTYAVQWISERGFANEGDYVYGTSEALQADINRFTRSTPRVQDVSEHDTKEEARQSAIAAAKDARDEYHESETIAIGVREAGKEQSQEDWEAVKYGENTNA